MLTSEELTEQVVHSGFIEVYLLLKAERVVRENCEKLEFLVAMSDAITLHQAIWSLLMKRYWLQL